MGSDLFDVIYITSIELCTLQLLHYILPSVPPRCRVLFCIRANLFTFYQFLPFPSFTLDHSIIPLSLACGGPRFSLPTKCELAKSHDNSAISLQSNCLLVALLGLTRQMMSYPAMIYSRNKASSIASWHCMSNPGMVHFHVGEFPQTTSNELQCLDLFFRSLHFNHY